MRTIRVAAVLAAVLLVPPRFAAVAREDPARELAKLEQRFETSALSWKEAYEAFLPEYEAFAKRHPGTEQALTARLRVLTFAGRLKADEAAMKDEAGRIVDAILAEFPRSEQLALLPDLWYLFHREKHAEVMKHLSAPDQPPRVKAAVLFSRAKGLWDSKRRDEARPLLEEILARYRDVPWRHTTYGEIADAMANPHDPAGLAVGSVCPEISGKDVEGRPLKLSDYKGRVVVLDFFGDW